MVYLWYSNGDLEFEAEPHTTWYFEITRDDLLVTVTSSALPALVELSVYSSD